METQNLTVDISEIFIGSRRNLLWLWIWPMDTCCSDLLNFGLLFRGAKVFNCCYIFVGAQPDLAALAVLAGNKSCGILVNFGPLFRKHKFKTADVSDIFCHRLTKFVIVTDLANRHNPTFPGSNLAHFCRSASKFGSVRCIENLLFAISV